MFQTALTLKFAMLHSLVREVLGLFLPWKALLDRRALHAATESKSWGCKAGGEALPSAILSEKQIDPQHGELVPTGLKRTLS